MDEITTDVAPDRTAVTPEDGRPTPVAPLTDGAGDTGKETIGRQTADSIPPPPAAAAALARQKFKPTAIALPTKSGGQSFNAPWDGTSNGPAGPMPAGFIPPASAGHL